MPIIDSFFCERFRAVRARYRILMVEVLKHNGRPETGAVYEAMDMDWAKLVDQMAHANGK
jgi:hypothetical protein